MRKTALPALLAGAALLLTACGTTEDAADAPTSSSSAAGGGTITIEDDRGTVELDGRPPTSSRSSGA